MSAALINRSLTNVRTELEFLLDLEVITQELYDSLIGALPQKYSKGMETWGADKLATGASRNTNTDTQNKADTPSSAAPDEVDRVTADLSASKIRDRLSPPANPVAGILPPRKAAPAIGYCRVQYAYDAQQPGDLALNKDDLVAVVEHLSPDWWKGYKKIEDVDRAGVFPANYVSVISQSEYEQTEKSHNLLSEKASYNPPPSYQAPQQYNQQASYGGYQQQLGAPLQQQNSYGGYAQFPPQSTNYYPPQQQNMPQQQVGAPQQQPQGSGQGHEHLKKFGSKLGNAAIFGAGATIGSDIVNSIF